VERLIGWGRGATVYGFCSDILDDIVADCGKIVDISMDLPGGLSKNVSAKEKVPFAIAGFSGTSYGSHYVPSMPDEREVQRHDFERTLPALLPLFYQFCCSWFYTVLIVLASLLLMTHGQG
jgi:hypothetical protein